MQTFDVIYEDSSIVAVLKPAGLPVHGPNGGGVPPESHLEGQVQLKFGKNLVLLHRLDRETSGVVLFSRNKVASAAMTQAFEQKKIRKAYIAVVNGKWPGSTTKIERRLARGEKKIVVSDDGQTALTTFRILKSSDAKSLIEAMPKTGRTHQIRVHCASEGHPILGDRLYGKEELPGALALHAYRVDFTHPETKKPMRLYAEPPKEWFTHWLKGLEANEIIKKLMRANSVSEVS